jgi:tetratricopeptide (TPR) repeat protein
MSDSFRTDGSRALEGVSDADRDAKIEQLLLSGLDHYLAARYEQAINVWTRALFVDRSHPRARAYIDRARSALAEQLRETEELLHAGVAAFDRGETAEAKRLLRAAIDGGAPAEEARPLLDRLSHERVEDASGPPGDAVATTPDASLKALPRAVPALKTSSRVRSRGGLGWLVGAALVAATVAGGYLVALRDGFDWRSILDLQPTPSGSAALPPAPRDDALPLPRRGEMMLGRARSLAAGGRLREALTLLDSVWSADPQKPEVDRLRADIQRQLIGLATRPSSHSLVRGRDKEMPRRP